MNAELGTLAYATDTDKVRVKASTGWVDVGGGGGGGSITSIAEGAGIDVTNPAGPIATVAVDFTQVAPHSHVTDTSNPHVVTKTQVGLSAVTNDAQLKRSANDWGGFTPRIPLQSGDRFLVEIDGTYAKGATTIDDIATYVGAGGGQTNPYLAPPASPNAFDDEFNSGSPDLAARGWVFYNSTTSVDMTRVGDIRYHPNAVTAAGSALTSNQYRSTLVGGMLLIEAPQVANLALALYKAVTLPSDNTVQNIGGRLSFRGAPSQMRALNPGNFYHLIGPTFWKLSGSRPDTNNQVRIVFYAAEHANPRRIQAGSRDGGAWSTYDQSGYGASPADDILVTTFTNSAGSSGGKLVTDAVSSSTYGTGSFDFITHLNMNPATTAFAGLTLETGPAVNADRVAYTWAIDFIRLQTGNMSTQWIANPI